MFSGRKTLVNIIILKRGENSGPKVLLLLRHHYISSVCIMVISKDIIFKRIIIAATSESIHFSI